jgi:hypothetical protein
MLFDFTFPCYLTTFSGKKCLSGKIICTFLFPAYRNSTVMGYQRLGMTAGCGSGSSGASRGRDGWFPPVAIIGTPLEGLWFRLETRGRVVGSIIAPQLTVYRRTSLSGTKKSTDNLPA